MIEYKTTLDGVDWAEAAEVFRKAPLGARSGELLERLFKASQKYVVAYDGPRLIGLARALSDGAIQAAIYDFVLLPEYQKRGLGRQMMKVLVDQLPVSNIILYSVPGREGFYRKCGFRKMLTAMAILHPVMAKPEAGYLENE
jgi:aralkylamine N-acetyltransferase